jgi:enoyl-CoA hydratase/carnithine racemase
LTLTCFEVRHEDGLCTVVLNRPEQGNSLNIEMLKEFEEILLQIRDDVNTRAVLFTGAGKAFCSGADVSGLRSITDPEERKRAFTAAGAERGRRISRVLRLISELEQPTIAAVNGYAVGGGWAIALVCDLVIASNTAQFWLPEVQYGVPFIAEGIGRLVQLVGPQRAFDLSSSGARITATQAETWGLVTQVAAPEELLQTGQERAKQLAATDARALGLTKAMIRASLNQGLVLRPESLLYRPSGKA